MALKHLLLRHLLAIISIDFQQEQTAMKAAIYSRVSTDTQTTDNQVQELMEVAQRHQWNHKDICKLPFVSAKGE